MHSDSLLFLMIPLSDVNIIAVVAATIACMALGFFWYSPKVFGDKWLKLTGLSQQHAQTDMKKAMITGLLATFISNYFIAVLLLLVGTQTIAEAATVALILWLATALPLELHGVAWEKRPIQLLHINASNALATFVLGAVVLQWWPL